MTAFDAQKKACLAKLYKPDKSKKGDVDEAIIPLIDAINKLDEYYTTSSCAGRISLLVEPEDGRKDHAEWHFVTHNEADARKVLARLEDLPKETVWFKMEAAILHVCARTEEAANTLLHAARESGFKHSGLLTTRKRYLLELIDSERIDVPVAVGGKLIVEEKFITFLVEKANKKLRATRENVEKLKKVVVKIGS